MKTTIQHIRPFSHVGFIPSWQPFACGRSQDTDLGRFNKDKTWG